MALAPRQTRFLRMKHGCQNLRNEHICALESRRLFTSVAGLSLMNADTDTVVAPLTNTTIINTLTIGTPRLNVRANVDATTASVRFALDGGNVLDSTSP